MTRIEGWLSDNGPLSVVVLQVLVRRIENSGQGTAPGEPVATKDIPIPHIVATIATRRSTMDAVPRLSNRNEQPHDEAGRLRAAVANRIAVRLSTLRARRL